MSQLQPLRLTGVEWRRSSFADDVEPQVEIAELAGGHVAIRASGSDDHVLIFTAAEWEAFVAGVEADEFGAPAP